MGTLKRRLSLPSILQQPELAELWDPEGRWDPNHRQRGGRRAPDPVHRGVPALLPPEGRGPPCTHLLLPASLAGQTVLPGRLHRLALPPFPRRPLQHCRPPSSMGPAFPDPHRPSLRQGWSLCLPRWCLLLNKQGKGLSPLVPSEPGPEVEKMISRCPSQAHKH